MASTRTFVWEKDALLALALMPDNSVPSYMSLVPFKLLPSAGAQREQVRVNPFAGPLREIVCNSSSPLSHPASIPTGFYNQELWRLLFLALELCAWEPDVGLGPLVPQRELRS